MVNGLCAKWIGSDFISVMISSYGCSIQFNTNCLNFAKCEDGSYIWYQLFDSCLLPGTEEIVEIE